MIGSAAWRSAAMKTALASTAMTLIETMTGDPQRYAPPPHDATKTMAVTATVMATMPATSILTGLTRLGADGRKAAPEAIAAAPKGRLIQNAHRQPSPSVSHPPRTGPSIAD